jgi:hypothetical protein
VSQELPRRFYLVLGGVALITVIVGLIASPSNYLINIVASITGFCTFAALVAPLLLQYERWREYPMWRLACTDLESAVLDAWRETFPASHMLGNMPRGPADLESELGAKVEEVGLVGNYKRGLFPIWKGERESGTPARTATVAELLAKVDLLQDEFPRLRSFELDGLRERMLTLSSTIAPILLSIDYDEKIAAGVGELRSAVTWLVGSWWWGAKMPPTFNLRERIESVEAEASTLRGYMSSDPLARGAQTHDDLDEDMRSAFAKAQISADELVVFMDKAAWVLAQMEAILQRLEELRSSRERLLARWPLSRAGGKSQRDLNVTAPISYKPRLLPTATDES